MRVRSHGLRKHGACAVHRRMHALFFPSPCPPASHSSALHVGMQGVSQHEWRDELRESESMDCESAAHEQGIAQFMRCSFAAHAQRPRVARPSTG